MKASTRELVDVASELHVGHHIQHRVAMSPDAIAISDRDHDYTYADLERRVAGLAGLLTAVGLRQGDRVAVLSENRVEYLELELAAARIGAIVACLNWRLTMGELEDCVNLVGPSLIVTSERHASRIVPACAGSARQMVFGEQFNQQRDAAEPVCDFASVSTEEGMVILYTSGTTGLPKGALISQRALTARVLHFATQFGFDERHSYIAWSPMFHMGGTDYSLATLMLGGKVIIHDGFDVMSVCDLLSHERIGWLLTMPGMVEELVAAIKETHTTIRSVDVVGCMADLVPGRLIAELTDLVNAPFLNTFGSTETGLPPASGGLLPPGEHPVSLAKSLSGLCTVRLVDGADHDVVPGQPGEIVVRSPTLFSGYWEDDEATAESFRNGWFHMGDVMIQRPDGKFDYVDRVKYLIKSGGENIYPAEIERVLRAHPAVQEVAVARKADARWGEVPVAFLATSIVHDDSQQYVDWCSERLARYKVPHDVRFIPLEDFPRSATGKIQRHELEQRWLQTQ
jgi:acyl-CoA synthetase (AMP-forming)/AMP-acid ligase II